MATQVGDKFAWIIKDPSSLRSDEKCYSPPVQIGDCKWRLRAYPNCECFSLFLEVADPESLPSGWRRYVKFRLTIVRQVSEKPSVAKEAQRWYHQKEYLWGFPSMNSLTKLQDKNEGFIVNGELVIVAELDFIQVLGLPKELETGPIKQINVESVSSTKETAVEFRAKIQHLKTACMNVLLSLTQTLCQTPQELSFDDLSEAEKTLAFMKDSGFEVDWLKKKLEEVKQNKKKEQSG